MTGGKRAAPGVPLPHGIAALIPFGSVAAQDDAIEEVVVTGSRIARADFESASPIVTLPASAFEQTSAITVERTLNTLPQFAASATGTSNDPANDGQANVSLRGIGVAQTLVLIDGRRLMPADGRGSPDLNVIPPALISSVEVVTGGASAAYGSDAIAGVVNFKLVDHFDGIEMDGQWSQTSQGDGDEYTIGMTAGTTFADGRGSVMGYVGYTEREQVNQSDREFSRVPLKYYPDETEGVGRGGAFLATGSGVTEEGTSVVFSSQAAFDSLFRVLWFSTRYRASPAGDQLPGGHRHQSGRHRVHDRYRGCSGRRGELSGLPGSTAVEQAHSHLQLRADHRAADAAGSHVGIPAWELRFHSGVAGLPAGAFLRLLGEPATSRPSTPASCSSRRRTPTFQPISGCCSTAAAFPNAPFRYIRRISEIGPRVSRNDRQLLQLTGGVTGRVFEDWNYDVYVQWGSNDRTEHQTGNASISRFQDSRSHRMAACRYAANSTRSWSARFPTTVPSTSR